MREEILSPKVENVAIAITLNEINGEKQYYAYLLNLRDDIMEGIIVNSRGYGTNIETGEEIKTSTLRHVLEVLLPNEAAKLEPIMPEVFGLTNEYFLSFWVEDTLYDKKFLFLPETIKEENMIFIEALGCKGIMIG